ncbi:MAG: branched-chain amino acid ABC transporter permease [Candidatus Velthaea sp.]
MIARRILTHPLLGAVIAFAVLPFLMPGSQPWIGKAGFVDLATTILVFALFASGFNLLFGHVGELSFGHAMFFSIGAYSTALYSKGFTLNLFGTNMVHGAATNMFAALAIAIGLALIWATLLARLIVPRSSGIYYSMITLAFAQVIYFITYKFGDFTGGEDGVQGVVRPQIPGLPADWLRDSWHYFTFSAIAVLIMISILYWVIASPFGSVLHAIRENKERARFLGYDVNKYRVNAFVISTIFPAVAGWLWAYYQTSINPDAGSIEYSGIVVMMSLLGGIQTFFGPMLGAFVYWELQNNIAAFHHAGLPGFIDGKYWEAAIGIVFAVFVLAAPRGIMGAIEDIRHYGFGNAFRRVLSRSARVETDMAEELPTVSQ